MTDTSIMFSPRLPDDRTIGGEGLATLAANLTAAAQDAIAIVEWANDEIAQAIGRHPDCADSLYHAFSLIRPREIGRGMSTELVYRSHARELLERIAADADTRDATAAEVCLVCKEISLLAPMHGAGAGLYHRMWQQAFPGHPITTDQAAQQVHYEQLHGPQIDDLERTLRSKTADPRRRLSTVECAGRHHGNLSTAVTRTSAACHARHDWAESHRAAQVTPQRELGRPDLHTR